MAEKIIIYQVLPRLFGNRNTTRKTFGTIAENGCGKFSRFDGETLHRIHATGYTHIWYTGVIRHATQTDYTAYGIPKQHEEVVKGIAGSPYAIADYYDVDPDLADDVDCRIEEWKALVARTHQEGLKVIMDFVPNHVAREYKSIKRPQEVSDLGETDNSQMNFSTANNFYYCWGQPLDLSQVITAKGGMLPQQYKEIPAKATGNDQFTSCPSNNDWYETVKLNYGIDYCDAGGRSEHFYPIPNTWLKMLDILLYWASMGVDGFRCDMAEMVPPSFWAYATNMVKQRYPYLIFVGEVYDTNQYRHYVNSGFDYLYDKVGMYDCLRDIICERRPASSITYQWQSTDDIQQHMLYFLENHDEQRIASDFFCGDGRKALPAVMVLALLRSNPFMVYAGQELGERGMDKEGFSGCDGRTTIFDYWAPDTLSRIYSDRRLLTYKEKELGLRYQQILRIANREKAVREGEFFDLMFANPQSYQFDPRHQYAFLRKKENELLLIIVNFSAERVQVGVTIPGHAFDVLNLPERQVEAIDLLNGDSQAVSLRRDGSVAADLLPYCGRIFKMDMKMDEHIVLLNEHHKDEFPPAHTAEHLLNQLMMRMFGCERSNNAHIERKKSKITYVVNHKPSRQEIKAIEVEMNRLIEEDLPVTYELVDRNHVPADVHLDRLPKEAGDVLRLVRIGDYDVCPCIGKHVRSTLQIGRFELLGTNWDEQTHSFRIRFKVIP